MDLSWLGLDIVYLIVFFVSGVSSFIASESDSKLEGIFDVFCSSAVLLLAQATSWKGANGAALLIGVFGLFIVYRVVKYHVQRAIHNFVRFLEQRQKQSLDRFYDRLMPGRREELFQAALLWSKHATDWRRRIDNDSGEEQRKLLIQAYAKAVGIKQ